MRNRLMASAVVLAAVVAVCIDTAAQGGVPPLRVARDVTAPLDALAPAAVAAAPVVDAVAD